jgi:hypothetical protein
MPPKPVGCRTGILLVSDFWESLEDGDRLEARPASFEKWLFENFF